MMCLPSSSAALDLSLMMRVCAAAEILAFNSRRSIASAVVIVLGPYKIAGMRPWRRSALAWPLRVARFSQDSSPVSIVASLQGSLRSIEERAYRFLIMNSLDCFRQQARHREHLDIGQLGLSLRAERNSVGRDNFYDVGFVQAIARGVGENRMGRDCDRFRRAGVGDDLGGLGDRAGGVDHVVDEQRYRILHFADQLHLGDFARAAAALVHDRE